MESQRPRCWAYRQRHPDCMRVCAQLPGVEACERYSFRYGRNPLMEWPLAFNPSGSARSEPKASQAKR